MCQTRTLQHLWTRNTLRALHQGWAQPTRQHDIVEYLGFERNHLKPSVAASLWRSRRDVESSIRVMDLGTCWPLWLPRLYKTPHLRRQGHVPLPCRGGITFSVDLRKAFDSMSRFHLATALESSQTDPAHRLASMRFAHANTTTEVPTTNGIRQGRSLVYHLLYELCSLVSQ